MARTTAFTLCLLAARAYASPQGSNAPSAMTSAPPSQSHPDDGFLPGVGLTSDFGYPASLSSEINQILPTNTMFPGDFPNSAAANTFLEAFSSIVIANPTYFPSVASDIGAGPGATQAVSSAAGGGSSGGSMTSGGAGGAGGLFTSVVATSSPQSSGNANTQTMTRTQQGGTGSSGQTMSATPSAGDDTNFGVAMSVPAWGLGLTGAVVAGVAGFAAFL